MDLGSFFRHFFESPFPSFPRPPPDGQNQEDQPPNWSNHPNFPMTSEMEQLDRIMTQMMHDTLGGLPDIFVNLSSLSEPPPHSPASLRDQMLKQQDQDIIPRPQVWEQNIPQVNNNVHGTFDKDTRLSILFPKPREDSLHYTTRSWSNFSSNVTSRDANGAILSQSVGSDNEGCRREKTTHELNGKKYVLEKRSCPGAPEQTTETLVNLNREELAMFLQHWQQSNKPEQPMPIADIPTVKNPDMFDKFFGPFK